jgi:small GTP-binding protein
VVSRKVAVLGFRAVGKSSLTNSFVTGSFSEVYDPTIESTHHKTIRFRKVHFATDIVDTAGMVSSPLLSRWQCFRSPSAMLLTLTSRPVISREIGRILPDVA